MDVAVGEGLAGSAWADERPGAHVARAAAFMVWSSTEAGHGCPVSMTYAVVPALRHAPDLAKIYEPLLTSRVYEPGLHTPGGKRGLLAGMGMTEKQGGTDVRANTTSATEQADGTWRLRGHKWFTSAPMNDLFLVLAQAPGGLSCFLVPRVLPDGSRNTFRIQRLKDKLGNRSNASSEPEFDDTVAWLVGAEGKGVRTIIDMVTMTRLDCVLGPPPAPAPPSPRPPTTPATARCSAPSSSTSRSCATYWPTSPWSPRPPPRSRCVWPAPPTAPSAATKASEPSCAWPRRSASTGCASGSP